jgi:hypothetical protein
MDPSNSSTCAQAGFGITAPVFCLRPASARVALASAQRQGTAKDVTAIIDRSTGLQRLFGLGSRALSPAGGLTVLFVRFRCPGLAVLAKRTMPDEPTAALPTIAASTLRQP